jgi:hypothetical protein
MNPRISALLATAAFALAGVLGSTETLAQNAYIANSGANTVSVINTAGNDGDLDNPCWQLSFRRHGHPGRWECLCR